MSKWPFSHKIVTTLGFNSQVCGRPFLPWVLLWDQPSPESYLMQLDFRLPPFSLLEQNLSPLLPYLLVVSGSWIFTFRPQCLVYTRTLHRSRAPAVAKDDEDEQANLVPSDDAPSISGGYGALQQDTAEQRRARIRCDSPDHVFVTPPFTEMRALSSKATQGIQRLLPIRNNCLLACWSS